MSRDLPVGNGSFLINFDRSYQIRDIYFPYVGEFIHTLGHPSRFGIWTGGHFSWLSVPDWKKTLLYKDDTLVTYVTAVNPQLGIKLVINDIVDCLENIYIRKITAQNLSTHSREILIFITHDLHLFENKACDTAYYDPEQKVILHYKKNQYFLINVMSQNNIGIEHFAVGIQDFKGAEGTWRDAEDGMLSGDPIADGSVDSTISFPLNTVAEGSNTAYYWMALGKCYEEVKKLNELVIKRTPEYFIKRTDDYWKSWLNIGLNNLNAKRSDVKDNLAVDLPDDILNLYKRSLLILRTQIDNGGAITAANDYDPVEAGMDGYSYFWPRDGAITAYALDEAGYSEITEKFFRFCANIISPEGYFKHKYNPDGTIGSSWHPLIVNNQIRLPIQEDGTALIIWAFWNHFNKHKNIEFARELYEPLVVKSANFMLNYRDFNTGLPLPSYDLWEERYGVHTFTASTVCAALKSASNFAEIFGDHDKANEFRSAAYKMKEAIDIYLFSEKHGRYIRTLFLDKIGDQQDPTLDSSLYGTFAFGTFDVKDKRIVSTMEVVRKGLTIKTNVGGIARYENDHLNKVSSDIANVPGNPWIICTLWMAQYLIAKAESYSDLQEAIQIMKWVLKHSFESGVIPEQLDPYTGQSIAVSPLSWSHSEFILTVHRFLEKLNYIRRSN
ncbi:MAG: glycoside hydrolase family 15 protein [bacterium]